MALIPTDPNAAAPRPATSVRGCPVCQGKDCSVLHAQRFILAEGHPLADGYNVVVCEVCGFVYADTAVSQRDYDNFYARYSKYGDVKISTGGGGSAEDAQRLKEMAADIAAVIPDRQSRLLDIGCAAGGLLKELELLGYSSLCGLDPAPACVDATKALCSADAFAGSLSALPEELGTFDGVFLSHVLEHVQDLEEALQAISRLIRPGGIVYVEVPDAARYRECLLAPFQDFNTEHINHFSAASLENLFLVHGWKCLSSGTKTLQVAPDMPYPATYAFFRLAEASEKSLSLQKDTELRLRILEYIDASHEMMQRIDQRIAVALEASNQVIVWGTGQLAMKLLGETCLGRADVVAFVDGNPINHGKVLRGIPILGPVEIQGSSTPIIVTSIIQARAISRAIAAQNLPNPVVLLGN